MAVFKSTSVKEVIGRVIRNTRLVDMTYADNMYEWLGEGAARLMIRWRLKRLYTRLKIVDHMAELPCGLVALNGVFCRGLRMRQGTGVIDARIQPFAKFITNPDGTGDSSLNSDAFSYFKTDTDPGLIANEQDLFYIRGTDLKPIYNITIHDFYQLELNYIKTSFRHGEIKIYFKKMDTDSEGYPLIPDLEEAKQALFWYLMGNLAMTGYKHNDPRMDYEYCDQKATKFFKLAKNMIKEQTQDEKEASKNLLVNLIPPTTYYETFFINGEQRKFIVK